MRYVAKLYQWLLQWFDLLLHPDPPDFVCLPWLVRSRLLGRAFVAFCCSAAGVRWVFWLLAWQLAAQLLGWNFDLGVRAQSWLGWPAAIWAWPYLVHHRRKLLTTLLRQRSVNQLLME